MAPVLLENTYIIVQELVRFPECNAQVTNMNMF